MANHIPPGTLPPDFDHTPGARAQGWSLVECGRTLYRNKTLLLSIAGIGMIAAGIISLIQPRMYQSQASSQIGRL